MCGKLRVRRGFTLVELLVVITIVAVVSAIALPTIRSSLNERGIQEAARLVQSTLTSARDDAVRHSGSFGVRFVPDPLVPDTCSRLMPIGPAPDYSEGLLTTTDPATLPTGFVLPYPCLMVEDGARDPLGHLTAPVAWPYNVRVGDQVRITPAGPRYTVVGPTDPANPTDDGFVVPVQVLDRQDGRGPLDYLWLTNGVDDDRNGFADDGWDGVDNNANGVKDEPAEWEAERWLQAPVVASKYTIRRRALPTRYRSSPGSQDRALALPIGVLIDTKGLPPEILIDATGSAVASGPYGVPSRFGLSAHEFRVHLIERGPSGNEAWVVINARSGAVTADVQSP